MVDGKQIWQIALGVVLAACIEELLRRYVFPRILPPGLDERGSL